MAVASCNINILAMPGYLADMSHCTSSPVGAMQRLSGSGLQLFTLASAARDLHGEDLPCLALQFIQSTALPLLSILHEQSLGHLHHMSGQHITTASVCTSRVEHA